MNCKRSCLLLVMSLFLFLNVRGADPYYENLFNDANLAYKEGAYDSAQTLYQEIAQNGIASAALYYNLGNTYFRTGAIPEAILYYERALKRAPQDEDIRYNLEIAEGFITDKIEPLEQVFFVRAWNGLSMTFHVDTWSILGILILFVSCALLTAFFIGKNRQVKQLGLLGGIVVFMSALLLFLLANTAHVAMNKPAAIVLAPTVNVKSEPGLRSADEFVIHEGLKVEILGVEGDWTRIALADGNNGWLPTASIEAI